MPGFLENLTLDRTSFWIGFLAGALFLWFFSLARPFLGRWWLAGLVRLQDMRASLRTSAEARFRREMLLLAQRQHLAAPLFALDEVMMTPRLLARPGGWEPSGAEESGEDDDQQLPYLPDWPELAARYGGDTLSLEQALSGGANLALLGRPGCGKTVALAYLACQVARRETSIGKLNACLPVLVHLADVLPGGQYTGQPLALLERALLHRSPGLEAARLKELLRAAFQRGRALLLLDGLDEQPPAIHAEAVKFLTDLLQGYPATRLVVAARPDDFSGLTGLKLVPVALAAWSIAQQRKFIVRWGENWRNLIARPPSPQGMRLDPYILNSWLLAETGFPTPLELTLTAWAAYAGEALGAHPQDSLEAHIRRMAAGLPKARPALESLALQMVLTLHPTLTAREARRWTGEAELAGEGPTEDGLLENDREEKTGQVKPRLARLGGMASDLVSAGLLISHAEGRLGFAHASLCAYLAAGAVAQNGMAQALASQPDWNGKALTAGWLAVKSDATPLVDRMLDSGPDQLMRGLLGAARWLPYAPQEANWRTRVLQLLVEVLPSEELPFNLRARALAALALSREAGLGALCRQMLTQGGEDGRTLGALGAGFLLEPQVTAALSAALEDRSPKVVWAASLALATIGSQPALESLAYFLLHGEEGARRAAAEALALHPGEGQAALQEGSEMDDLLVRRAVVFGLARADQPWARQILEKLAVDDKEWVVRAAAALAVERLQAPTAGVPTPPRSLSETPRLIAFAAEHELGLSPGRQAFDLLLRALQEGTPAQRMAALQALEQVGEPAALPLIYQILAEGDGQLCQAAFQTLWSMAGAGLDVANPIAEA